MPGDGDGKRAGLMQRRGKGDEDTDSGEEGSSMSEDESEAEREIPVPLTGAKRALTGSAQQRKAHARGAAGGEGPPADEPAAKLQRAMDRAELKAAAKLSRAELGIAGAWSHCLPLSWSLMLLHSAQSNAQ